jgi:hypothetical protein
MQSAIPERPSTDHAWRRISALVSLEARLLLGPPILSRSFATTAALQATSSTRSDVILMGNAHGCKHTGALVAHLVARRSALGSKFDSDVTPEPQREAARLRGRRAKREGVQLPIKQNGAFGERKSSGKDDWLDACRGAFRSFASTPHRGR